MRQPLNPGGLERSFLTAPTRTSPSPHFSQAFYCGVGYGHVNGVALGRAPRHTVKYACGALRRAPCIHTRLRRLARKSCEKCGLGG